MPPWASLKCMWQAVPQGCLTTVLSADEAPRSFKITRYRSIWLTCHIEDAASRTVLHSVCWSRYYSPFVLPCSPWCEGGVVFVAELPARFKEVKRVCFGVWSLVSEGRINFLRLGLAHHVRENIFQANTAKTFKRSLRCSSITKLLSFLLILNYSRLSSFHVFLLPVADLPLRWHMITDR